MDVVESKWYEMDMPLNDVKKLLSANIKTMSRSFIAAGYYMKYIRDRELFRDGGYNSIWEFAEDQYGIKKSAASRWMAMNDKFSKDGNSPILDDKYKDFNKSQLQEMLYLTDEQMEEAEPEMSAKEIRAIRKPPEVEVIAPAQQIDDQIPGQDSIEQHPEYMPGKMTIETATGQNRPPENEIPITPELQIEGFFEALNKGDKERVLTCDINATTYGEEEEAEANFFAKYALAPPPLIDNFIENVTPDAIRTTFDLSNQAAKYAYWYYRSWLYNGIGHYTDYEEKMLDLFKAV